MSRVLKRTAKAARSFWRSESSRFREANFGQTNPTDSVVEATHASPLPGGDAKEFFGQTNPIMKTPDEASAPSPHFIEVSNCTSSGRLELSHAARYIC